jgi:hypothetical protein
MLIFWKLILEEDLDLYKQDPTSDNQTVTSSPCNVTSSCITTLDRTINYIVGAIFILPFLSSTTLNPLLFWYFNRTKSKANTLFKVLAVYDFFTTLFTPLTYTVLMFDKKLYASSNPALRQARPFCCIFGCISQVSPRRSFSVSKTLKNWLYFLGLDETKCTMNRLVYRSVIPFSQRYIKNVTIKSIEKVASHCLNAWY